MWLALSLAVVCVITFRLFLVHTTEITVATKFDHFHNYDMSAHDFSCEGSLSPVGCTLMVSSVENAFDMCLSLARCGAFVISNRPEFKGLFITWF